MPSMVDPMEGLKSFQNQLKKNGIKVSNGEIHPEVQVHLDHPGGEFRLSYANVHHGRVRAFVTYIPSEPFNGLPCFSIGYAVPEKFRNQGLGAEIVEKSIDELKNGYSRNGISKFYIEAVVAESNVPSQKLAEKVISPVVDRRGNDSFSGEPALTYMRLVEA
ncbi:MAG: GNAT family N-acetyltransferase [Pseudomonas qingdaonensis]|uniref:GNAT family N-acetyltransferase n=1 Tax=Pseudomonas qingdaonensis TaxID=2056231 RepID=UPI001E37660F